MKNCVLCIINARMNSTITLYKKIVNKFSCSFYTTTGKLFHPKNCSQIRKINFYTRHFCDDNFPKGKKKSNKNEKKENQRKNI